MRDYISTEYNLNIVLDFFFLKQSKTTQVNLYKDVISTQAVKQMQNGQYEKGCEIQVVARMVGQWQEV